MWPLFTLLVGIALGLVGGIAMTIRSYERGHLRPEWVRRYHEKAGR
jgi:hypothetical protein